jgi:prepilin-type N-terminal cleavage/methylation domain-containing protein
MKNNKGFTLVELLVVIAIIGILSTVAVINLNSAREKARSASIQAALSQITSAAILCHDDGVNIAEDGSLATIVACGGTGLPAGTKQVCDDAYTEAVWPNLNSATTGWYYDNNCNSSVTGATWNFSACEGTAAGTCTVGGRRVDCSQTGCATGVSTAA